MNQPSNRTCVPRGETSFQPSRSAIRSPQTIGLYAVQSLHQELAVYPKPGLVSPVDNGSHQDMNAALFFRSLFALRGYFRLVAAAGMRNATFAELKELGIAAETRMMAATGGVNTHRGAIFNLGLLAAAAGSLHAADLGLRGKALGARVRNAWGEALQHHGDALPRTSHGSLVASRYGVGGAMQEALAGFPHVFEVGLPELQECLESGLDPKRAAVQCLFRLMAVLPDTNLLYRGGDAGLDFAQKAARTFLAKGGVRHPEWRPLAVGIHREFVARNLSPGGSADLLAATLFVHRLQDRRSH